MNQNMDAKANVSSPTISKQQSTSTPAWSRLRPGDKVLITGSSWPISWDRDERAAYIKNIRELIEGTLGLKAVIPDILLDEPFDEHYIHDVQHRAEMDKLAHKDSDIKMIWNLQGGYGALESCKAFDEWRKAHPNALKNGIPEIGFSDVTVKLLRKGQAYNNGKQNVSGVISPIHGPTLMHMIPKPNVPNSPERQASIDQYVKVFKKLFMDSHTADGIKHHNTSDDSYFNLKAMNDVARKPGLVLKGEALGGHTSRVTTSFGTEWEIGKNHSGIGDDKVILTIESDDVPELEMFLQHIQNTALWPKISAIALGHIVPLESRFTESKAQFYDAVTKQRLLEIAAKYDKPIFGELPIGHTLKNAFLPMLTPCQLTVCEDGEEAQLKVHTFRSKESVNKKVPAFDPAPEKRFSFSRKRMRSPSAEQPLSLVKDIRLIPINPAAKKTRSMHDVDIVGADIGEEQMHMGTPKQLDTAGKIVFFHSDMRHPDQILTLAGDETSAPHFSSLVKANMVRFLAHMNEGGMFKEAKALIIGDIIPPSGAAYKSQKYLKEFNRELAVFLKENKIDLPVYRAEGHQFLPSRFHMAHVSIDRTGMDNLSKLSSDVLKALEKDKPKASATYLGGA